MLAASPGDLSERLSSRQKTFMQGPDLEEAKRKRDELGEELRKSKRMEMARKRRNMGTAPTSQVTSPPSYLPDFPSILSAISASSDSSTLQAASSLRKLLSTKVEPPIQQVIDLGLVPVLLTWLHLEDFPALQYEACWAITNIASGLHEQALALVSKGVIPLIYRLLDSPSDSVREQAVWLIGNLAGDSAQIRDALLQTKCMQNVLRKLEGAEGQGLRKIGCWAVSNLCRGKPQPKYEMVAGAIPFLCEMVMTLNDHDALIDPLWALSNLCASRNERVQLMLTSGVEEKLAELAREGEYKTTLPALRCLGNIASGNQQQTQVILDLNIVPLYKQLLCSDSLAIRKEAAWTLSNLAAGSKSQVLSLLTSDMFPTILSILPTDKEQVQTELLWALHNAAMANISEVVRHLVSIGTVQVVGRLLETGTVSVIYSALDVVKALLVAGKEHMTQGSENKVATEVERSCLSLVESLQNHANQQIYQKSFTILSDFFEIEEPSDPLSAAILSIAKFEL